MTWNGSPRVTGPLGEAQRGGVSGSYIDSYSIIRYVFILFSTSYPTLAQESGPSSSSKPRRKQETIVVEFLNSWSLSVIYVRRQCAWGASDHSACSQNSKYGPYCPPYHLFYNPPGSALSIYSLDRLHTGRHISW